MQIPQPVLELAGTGPLTHLTTINPDGSPEVTVIRVGIENSEVVMGHLGLWKKVQSIRRDPRVALSMLGLNPNPQGLRESLVVYGRARITEGGAPPPAESGANLHRAELRVSPTRPAHQAGYITRVAPAQMRGIGPWIEIRQ